MTRIAIGAITRTIGGPATYAVELVRALGERRTPGLEYTVLTDGPEAFADMPVAVEHLPLRTPWMQPLWDHVLVPRALRRVGADLYHGTKNVVPLGCRSPAVVTIHDLAVYHHPESFALAQRWHLRAETPHAARAACAIVTVSEHAAADLRARTLRRCRSSALVTDWAAGRSSPTSVRCSRGRTSSSSLRHSHAPHRLSPAPSSSSPAGFARAIDPRSRASASG